MQINQARYHTTGGDRSLAAIRYEGGYGRVTPRNTKGGWSSVVLKKREGRFRL